MEIIRPPHIDTRPDQPYMGIRTITPFRGMTAMTRQLGKEVDQWIMANGVETAGPPFVRLHVVDMRGEMDLTCGVPVAAILSDDGRITSGVLPGGRYASLVFTGNGVAGNGALIDWVRALFMVAAVFLVPVFWPF